MAINKKIKIVLTSGDQDGIGPEVCAKALAKIGPKSDVQFYLWRSPLFGSRNLRLIDRKFKRITVASWPEALRQANSKKYVIDICSTAPPPSWVESAANAAVLKTIDAIVTAPLSKTLIASSGLKDLGHTDIFARIAKRKNLFMTFLGSHFHVLLATGHIPLSHVPAQLTTDQITLAVRAAHSLAQQLKIKARSPRLALVGLNPHAGETGLIGNEESLVFSAALKDLRNAACPVDGPLIPDVAFLSQFQKIYDVYVSPYHDQGLIPFKLIHERKGCHLTMGLPFLRTSVDHGTAKDIYGKHKADSSSMQEAINRAILLSRLSFKPDAYLL
ncbi:4-hydroxythreonine-4-phosphate dehydrogenase PdxA [bacterium]|nr:4-hydroxythreonine-4-phosphate dehydrogenase PdxA [bacterium]